MFCCWHTFICLRLEGNILAGYLSTISGFGIWFQSGSERAWPDINRKFQEVSGKNVIS